MRPEVCYTIWFSQRTGSTLLCRALESTGVAGHPGEHLEGALPDLYARHGVHTPLELVSRVWEIAQTRNGVAGIKYGLVENTFGSLIDAPRQIEGHDGSRPGIWANAFPNCRHILMTRRNKVRLAVSWWKAIQSQEWHRLHGASPRVADISDRYAPEAIEHLVVESILREAAMQEFLALGGIAPLTVVYEDFVSTYEQTILNVLRWLGIDSTAVTLAPPALDRLSDELSEQWVERFRRDKQRSWQKVVW